MNTLVLVLGARVAPYRALIRTIKRTWASLRVPDVDTVFYHGGNCLDASGDELTLPVPDGEGDIGRKTIACFEYVLRRREFDVVFRTNCSSYVDLQNLRDYVRARPNSRFYSGYIRSGEIPYASGAGYFLSRDLVELVVEQQSRWDHDLVDDRALGELLARSGIRPTPALRQVFRTVPAVEDIDTSLFHFRCRTMSWCRFEDRCIMLRVHRAFCAERGLPTVAEGHALRALLAVARMGRAARRVVAKVR